MLVPSEGGTGSGCTNTLLVVVHWYMFVHVHAVTGSGTYMSIGICTVHKD